MGKKLFSFDAETNGLWGKAFSIGAIVYDENGAEIARFVGRCPIEGETDEWVAENVIPKMTSVPVSHEGYDSLLADFARFYLANKADSDIVVHMGNPVETGVLWDAHDKGYIGDWDGPYPCLAEVSIWLEMAGEKPDSVDGYVRKHGLVVPDFGTTHNPLYDSAVAAVAYRHLRGWTV